MADPRAFHMGLTQVPPYGFAPQLIPQAYHNPYGYIGPRSHLPTHLTLHPAIAEAPPGLYLLSNYNFIYITGN
jgi:hypothetical protein